MEAYTGTLDITPPMSDEDFRTGLKPLLETLPGGMAEPYTLMAIETVPASERALFIQLKTQRLSNPEANSTNN